MTADLFAGYQRIDSALAKAGVPPTSGWWLSEVERFYSHPTATRWIGKVGRGGAKSTIGRKMILAETLLGEFSIPIGERHFAILVSARSDEARLGIVQLSEYLRILGVGHDVRADDVELPELRRVIRVLPCSVAAQKGPRCFAYLADELATWNVDGSNPARDVVASLDAATITHPNARGRLFSSPWADDDYHHIRFTQGDTEHQIVSSAPSWVANPGGITQADCKRLAQGDERVFRRDYEAVATGADDQAYASEDITACIAHAQDLERVADAEHVLALDASGGRKDSYAAIVGHRELRAVEDAPPIEVIVVDAVRRWSPKSYGITDRLRKIAGRPTEAGVSLFESFISDVAALARRYRVRKFARDNYAADSIASAMLRLGVRLGDPLPMSLEAQARRFAGLGVRFRQRTIELPNHEPLIAELKALRVRSRSGGREAYEAPKNKHDDLADCLALVVDAASTAKPGGDIRSRLEFGEGIGGALTFARSWQRRVVGKNGSTWIPTLPPEGTRDAARARAERQAHGIVVPEDLSTEERRTIRGPTFTTDRTVRITCPKCSSPNAAAPGLSSFRCAKCSTPITPTEEKQS